MIHSQKRGVTILIIVLISTFIVTVLSCIGYVAYKYRETTKENALLKAQFDSQKSQVFEESQTQKTDIDLTSDNDSITVNETIVANQQDEIDLAVSKAIAEQTQKQKIVVPIQETKVEESEVVSEKQVEDSSPIKVIRVGQTAYPDGYGGVYGSYGMTINVTAQGGDILIPMTTTDSLGTGNIGFSYSILGGSFKGTQDSEISSCTLRVGNNCKIKDGQSKDMKVTVWLTPDQDSDGNYAVQFDRVLYFLNGEQKTFKVNQSSEKIHLYY